VERQAKGEDFQWVHEEDTAPSDLPRMVQARGKGAILHKQPVAPGGDRGQHLWVSCCHALAAAAVILLILWMQSNLSLGLRFYNPVI